MDLSIITVTYQSREFIPYLINSAMTCGVGIDYEHFVVDNGSRDGTVELIQEQFGHLVHLIANQRNEGFAAANHAAVKRAKGRYLLFLNPDMALEPYSMDEMIRWMDAHPEIGVSGCRLLDVNGQSNPLLHPRRFPKWPYFVGYFLGVLRLFPSFENSFLYSNFSADREQEVDHVRGAFMLVRREIIEQMGRAFDLRYYLLVEDMDFCREVRALGYRVVYTPRIACTDYFHQSFHRRSQAWKFWCLTQSLFQYLWKWESRCLTVAIACLFPVAVFVRIPQWVRDCLRNPNS